MSSEKNIYAGVFKAPDVNPIRYNPGRFIFAVLIFTFLFFSRHPIVGSSMYPTYTDGQSCIAVKAVTPLSRGQVVVAFAPSGKLLIKRIIGMPGDTVEIDAEGKTYVNGELSAYGSGSSLHNIAENVMEDNGSGGKVIRLDSKHYFLMGDNREASADSRLIGPVTRTDIWEVVLFVF